MMLKKFNLNSPTTFLLIFFCILVFINLISFRHFLRLDLTSDHSYTLSSASKTVLKNTDDLIKIKGFISQNLPTELTTASQYVKDILTEYQAFSPLIEVEYLDPAQNAETEQTARSLGIPQIQMSILKKDKYEKLNGYFGLAILYGNNSSIIPFLNQVNNLEYEITTAIRRLTTKEKKNVSFTINHKEHGLYDIPVQYLTDEQKNSGVINDYTQVAQALGKLYNVQTIDLTNQEELAKVDTLIIAGPKEKFTEEEIFKLDQYLMRGGNLIFMYDTAEIANDMKVTQNNIGLDPLLKNYGTQISSNFVLDASNEMVSFRGGIFIYQLNYPFWIKTLKENFLATNPVVSKIESISFPWMNQVIPIQIDNVENIKLITTTEKAWVMSPPYNLDPNQEYAPQNQQKETLILLNKGKFTSYFADKQIPKVNDQPIATEIIKESQKENSLIFIGDSEFVSDDFLSDHPSNLELLLNAVDYLSLDFNLIDIRSKEITDRPIKNISETEKNILRTINIIGLPLLVIALGLAKFIWRKKQKNNLYL